VKPHGVQVREFFIYHRPGPRSITNFDHAGIRRHARCPLVTAEIVDTLEHVAPVEWNRLAGDDPFLSHEFLSALHETGCASPATGWTPQYLLLRQEGALCAALPLYLKDHSYGEYVFDWAWADAYQRNGVAYYPKLLSAVPFTPVRARGLLADDDAQRERLIAAALALAKTLKVSSLHFLFPSRGEAERMQGARNDAASRRPVSLVERRLPDLRRVPRRP
jgi:predicted N-acyltransferase